MLQWTSCSGPVASEGTVTPKLSSMRSFHTAGRSLISTFDTLYYGGKNERVSWVKGMRGDAEVYRLRYLDDGFMQSYRMYSRAHSTFYLNLVWECVWSTPNDARNWPSHVWQIKLARAQSGGGCVMDTWLHLHPLWLALARPEDLYVHVQF